jgi:hypothetical protein
MEYNLNPLLQKVTVSLAAYLEKVLPTILEDWWKQAVLFHLSIQQQSRIKQRNINSLAALNLANTLARFHPHKTNHGAVAENYSG